MLGSRVSRRSKESAGRHQERIKIAAPVRPGVAQSLADRASTSLTRVHSTRLAGVGTPRASPRRTT